MSRALTEAPVLAHVVRSGVVESVHRASVAVTRADGSLDWQLGDASGPVFARSSNKPLQAVAMVRAGLDLPPPQLALACASHSGEPFHLETVLAVLAGAGLGEDALHNTPDLPYDEQERAEGQREGRPRSSLAQNCSGKHAAMVATCVANGWDVASYLDPGHPLQQAVLATMEELTGERVTAVAVDGCGAPLQAYALVGLARGFGRVAAARDGAERRVADAVRAWPEYLGGTRRAVTALVREVPGLVAKDGAESVYAVGLPDGRGIAVKVADGFPRAAPVVVAAVLRRLGVTEPDALAQLEYAPVLGHGEPVGAVVAVGI